MLEKLHIRNYRIFRDLEIDQLRRINLIAGRNNSGKTSLLEAIFLLAGGWAELAINGHVARVNLEPGFRWVGDNLWKSFFNDLDMRRYIEIEGWHSSHGRVALGIKSGRQQVSDILVDTTDGLSATNLPNEHTLFFEYTPSGGETITSHIQEIGTKIKGEQPDIDIPFRAAIVLSRLPIAKKMPDDWQT